MTFTIYQTDYNHKFSPKFDQIRVDAWNLCTFKRRPHICIAEDVGKYDSY